MLDSGNPGWPLNSQEYDRLCDPTGDDYIQIDELLHWQVRNAKSSLTYNLPTAKDRYNLRNLNIDYALSGIFHNRQFYYLLAYNTSVKMYLWVSG